MSSLDNWFLGLHETKTAPIDLEEEAEKIGHIELEKNGEVRKKGEKLQKGDAKVRIDSG